MHIVVHSPNFEEECDCCHSLIAFTYEDIELKDLSQKTARLEITCPVCHRKIEVTFSVPKSVHKDFTLEAIRWEAKPAGCASTDTP
jgi:nitrate/TMAO reductase-like tetraheme cytochrome c subunit